MFQTHVTLLIGKQLKTLDLRNYQKFPSFIDEIDALFAVHCTEGGCLVKWIVKLGGKHLQRTRRPHENWVKRLTSATRSQEFRGEVEEIMNGAITEMETFTKRMVSFEIFQTNSDKLTEIFLKIIFYEKK